MRHLLPRIQKQKSKHLKRKGKSKKTRKKEIKYEKYERVYVKEIGHRKASKRILFILFILLFQREVVTDSGFAPSFKTE